jgi:hypothetical protein
MNTRKHAPETDRGAFNKPLPIPEYGDRARRYTAGNVRRKLDAETRARILACAALGPEAISERIEQLDREWSVDRVLMAGVGINVLVGLALGRTVNRAWYVFPAVVASFLLLHVFQGWCPPLPVFRRLGIRTGKEIALEREALKALRGDFQDLPEEGADLQERVGKAVASTV